MCIYIYMCVCVCVCLCVRVPLVLLVLCACFVCSYVECLQVDWLLPTDWALWSPRMISHRTCPLTPPPPTTRPTHPTEPCSPTPTPPTLPRWLRYKVGPPIRDKITETLHFLLNPLTLSLIKYLPEICKVSAIPTKICC